MAFAVCGSNSIKIEFFDLMGNTLFSKILAGSNNSAYQTDIPEIFSFQPLLNFATR
jgi:hypothetical protein